MAKINVIWVSYNENAIPRGYWDQGLLEDIFKKLDVKQYVSFRQFEDYEQGAIVIVNGRTHTTYADEINADIQKLRWVLFIDTGDEEAVFPWREIKHPIMRVWMMLPRMNVHNDTHYKLPNGYRPETHETLKKIGYQEKEHDYSFIGQINHDRREQCLEALSHLKAAYPKAFVLGTQGFGKEDVKYDEYMSIMAKSKIVACPSGVESPDNFRLYEALEAGALPIVDAFSSKHKAPGFWRYLFGDNIPFPIIDYWDAALELIPHLIDGYPANANRAFAWWQLKKREIRLQLLEDVKELSK